MREVRLKREKESERMHNSRRGKPLTKWECANQAYKASRTKASGTDAYLVIEEAGRMAVLTK
jgi:hypothetical protein